MQIIFLLVWLLMPSWFGLDVRMEHDIHLSKCEMIKADKADTYEVSISIFYDDLLSAFGLKIGEELPEDYSNSDELIQKFIDKHFILEINGETKELTHMESFSYPPAIWTTFKVEHQGEFEELKIKNTILLDLFDDQKNIVSFPWKGKTKTIAMDHSNHLVVYRK